MKEDFKNLIDEEFDKLGATKEDKEDLEKIIQGLVNNQNEKAKKEIAYRKKLLDALEKVKRMKINVIFNDQMSTKELEKILRGVKL